MDSKKERRDRLVVLSFVSIMLMLVYGPLAEWFHAADHLLYDTIATHVGNETLDDGVIVSVNPAQKSAQDVSHLYGQLVGRFQDMGAARIVITEGPQPLPSGELPGWAAALGNRTPMFVPRGHPF
ncbi:MAG TPA: hypothetical protein VFY27_04000, partial [Woeseiaceae bacterium]|nr:hypothetical protein [Woeseiaceae bacterium]